MNSILMVLIISLIMSILIVRYLYINRKKGLLYKELMFSFIFLCIHIFPLIFQIYLKNSGINLIYFDYFSYIGAVYNPIGFLLVALTYGNPKINLRKYWFLSIFPIISLIILWTNDFHHLFYKVYSVNLDDMVMGEYLLLYTIYSYTILVIAFIILLNASIKKSGFFSKQTALIITGVIVPLLGNILGTLKIIHMSIYITPILFIVTTICFAISIIKYKALNITPVALRTVIDTMSDAFVVISADGTIAEKNMTFEKSFNNILKLNKNDNFFEAISVNDLIDMKDIQKNIEESKKINSVLTKEYNIVYDNFNKYFEVDIQPIKAKSGKEYIGTLLLFKDITQHKKDIQEIVQKQDIIVKQGQLSSIGELAGGMAHDINTPIAAIKTSIVMFRDMLGKRTPDEMEILQNMDNCADKIIKIVNSVRNQIRNLGSDQIIDFKISDVINDIKIMAFNELSKHHCELISDIEDDIVVTGDPTKFSQVITNLVVNAIQAYDEKGGKVIVKVMKAPNDTILITVTDFAGGIPDEIKPYIFKNILTTKGITGTGLGLYLAYSVIKGVFKGDITFESEKNNGTTFYITIPKKISQ